MIAGLEADLRSIRLAHGEIAQDNRGCYNQIRAKDKELDAAAVQLEHARAVLVENKASTQKQAHNDGFPCIECRVSSHGSRTLQLRSWLNCPGWS